MFVYYVVKMISDLKLRSDLNALVTSVEILSNTMETHAVRFEQLVNAFMRFQGKVGLAVPETAVVSLRNLRCPVVDHLLEESFDPAVVLKLAVAHERLRCSLHLLPSRPLPVPLHFHPTPSSTLRLDWRG